VNDQEMGGPTTEGEWKPAIKLANGILELHEKHKLSPYLIDLFININQIKTSVEKKD
jgi:hypothetical protein